MATTPASAMVITEATVLGHVQAEMKKGKGYSYTDLFKEAQKKYPQTQEVIHIQIDEQSNGRYLLHGIAICYKN